MKDIIRALRLLAVLTLLTGGIYPFAVWAMGRAWFRSQAEGSLVIRDGQVIGSALLAQKTASPRYFQPRPSAGDYATVASVASNQAWTSRQLVAEVNQRRAFWGNATVPGDLLTASGSGLDPDLSLAAVQLQASRVAAARHLDPSQRAALDELIARLAEGGQFAPRRINVLRLNLALDHTFPENEHRSRPTRS
jgi:K+-transporting ATPase ATPase C chain